MTHVHDAPVWIKSKLSSTQGSCVEVSFCGCGETKFRNSRDPDGPVLTYTAAEWAAFRAGVLDGEFD